MKKIFLLLLALPGLLLSNISLLGNPEGSKKLSIKVPAVSDTVAEHEVSPTPSPSPRKTTDKKPTAGVDRPDRPIRRSRSAFALNVGDNI